MIELLLVIAIVLIVSAMSVSFYGRFLTQNSVSNTQDQLVQTMRKAQSYAAVSRKSSTSGWGVNYASSTITLYQGPNYAGRNTALDETFSVNSAVSISPTFDINFPRVTASPSGSIVISISGQGNSKKVNVGIGGVVTR